MKNMCVRIWLEIGHSCEPQRSELGRTLPLDWRVWVRGVSGQDISTFVHKVVFYLHPSTVFVYPKRVIQEPPYEIQESGCASIEIPIHVYLKYSDKKKIRLKYSLQIESINKSSSRSSCFYYDFKNPSEELWRALMKGGGEVVGRAGASDTSERADNLLVSDDKSRRRSKSVAHKKYKFVKPLNFKHAPKKDNKSSLIEEICAKYSDPAVGHLKSLLRTVEMTEDEINKVTQLYLLNSSYDKAPGRTLELPPWSSVIYQLPDPLSTRPPTLSDIDYVLR